MIAPRAGSAVRPVARALAIAGLALAVAGCTGTARRRLVEALFDEPPSKRPPETARPASQPPAAPAATREASARPMQRLFPAEGSTHGPYAASRCDACHLTRGQDEARGALGLSLARLRLPKTELCLNCHVLRELRDVAAEPGGRLHGPVAAGRCTACHGAHAARERFLLLRPRKDLCTSCHGASRGPDHPEVAPDECLDCHAPHVVGDFGS
ncbi:MAG: hypothetical protein D6738_00205 [Acidobacteria bacterium]|nr:MAG: hypothetical protein D6738_00205 [Acidobacteriota bacterium]